MYALLEYSLFHNFDRKHRLLMGLKSCEIVGNSFPLSSGLTDAVFLDGDIWLWLMIFVSVSKIVSKDLSRNEILHGSVLTGYINHAVDNITFIISSKRSDFF